MKRHKATLFPAGMQYDYSQIGYDLLAKIAEKTSGKSFIELSSELFRKCGMDNTSTRSFKDLPSGIVDSLCCLPLPQFNTFVTHSESLKLNPEKLQSFSSFAEFACRKYGITIIEKKQEY